MPKYKSESHKIVLKAAKEEFLEKGYENASIRAIGKKAGMTSAGLYRHAKNKEELFTQIVQPAHDAVFKWIWNHRSEKYMLMDGITPESITTENIAELFRNSEIDMIAEVAFPYREELRLLITKSKGTHFENLFRDFVEMNHQEMMRVLKFLKEKGFPVADVNEIEMHSLLSAYTTALFEPIIHNYSLEETKHCLRTIDQFFTPGWKKIMGI